MFRIRNATVALLTVLILFAPPAGAAQRPGPDTNAVIRVPPPIPPTRRGDPDLPEWLRQRIADTWAIVRGPRAGI